MNDSYAYESNNNEISNIYHYQFSSVTQSCLTLCEPMNRSMPGIPVDHQLPESTQTHVHCVSDILSNNLILCHPLLLLPSIFPSISSVQFTSVTQSRPTLCNPMICSTPGLPVHHQLLEFTSLSQWCHPAISSSVIPFSSCPQSLPASGSFPMSQLFAWGGQSTEVSALASFRSKNIQDWSPLEWTSWISLQSRGLSRVFSNITVQKHQFFNAQPSS